MRPHITEREAQYLVELLQASQNIHSQLEVYFQDLEKEVYRLNKLRETQPFEAMKQGYTTKKAELVNWANLRLGLAYAVDCNKDIQETLLLKYQNMAQGNKHRGVYKHLNNVLDIRLCIRDKGALQTVLEKDLQPIETLGAKPQ